MTAGAGPWTDAWEALRAGQPAEAERLVRAALADEPSSVEGWFLLGIVCHDQGRPAEAAEGYSQALRQRPDLPEAPYNFGNALRDLGRLNEASDCYTQAIRLRPDYTEAYCNLGLARRDQGQPAKAAECYRMALGLNPDLPEVHLNLGTALRDLRQTGEAAECFRQALRLRPDYPVALNNLGNVLRDLGRPDEAMACLRRALDLRPNYPIASYNLGLALLDLGRPGKAAECFWRTLELRPDFPDAHQNLALALCDLGRLDEAIKNFQRVVELEPSRVDAHDGLLLTLNYKDGVTPQELAAAHADYQDRRAAPLRACWRPHSNDRNSERTLRRGFVSPDFGRHPVGYLLVRVAEALAAQSCVVICYSNRIAPPDELTVRFRAASGTWRDTANLTDDRLAELVRADGIDVLIDLAGHTRGNRLLAFARRPAPVQCTWLGYPGSTGLEAIDYLIADWHQVPPGAEDYYRERVLRLPGGYASYEPPAGAPQPGPPPALAGEGVTFGCFNNPAKLSGPALAAFAAILRRVSGARIVLKYRGLDDPTLGRRLLDLFTAAGVGQERVELRGASGHVEHLTAYQDIDVALGPFPYGEGVTTCDALWMGVPVVTLPGDTFASRHALSRLSAVGIAEGLAARDMDDYVDRAVELASDLSRQSTLRAGLREQMARSPLCDGGRCADELLSVLRGAWREWVAGVTACASPGPVSP